jgi:hypothetical protein
LQHDALERRAFARASVRNHLRRTGYSLEFRPEEHQLDIKLHGTDDDRKLMA